MKRYPDKRKKIRLRFTVITGIILLCISSAVSLTGGFAFRYIYKLSFVNDKNGFIFWLAIITILFIFAGGLLNLALAVIFTRKTEAISSAMKKIIDGEFSAKLHYNGKITDPGIKAVESFNEMALQLKNTKMLNEDFINSFSHDIKTPLGNITGFAKLLKSADLSAEEKNEYTDIIIEETRKLSQLSDNVLMLLRLEGNKISIDMQDFNLTEQLRQIAASLFHKWNEKGIEIVLEGNDINICAVRDLLSQMWLNLLDNAIKFSPEGKCIYISAIKNADLVSVSIKNYGCTLSESEIPFIFEKFYQSASAHSASGNGLGLSLVKNITKLHGGTVHAELCDKDAIVLTVNLPSSQ